MNKVSTSQGDFIDYARSTGVLNESSASRLAAVLAATNHPIDSVIIELGLMREDALARCFADHLQLNYINQPSLIADIDQFKVLGKSFLAANALVPVRLPDDSLGIATANPMDQAGLEMITYLNEVKPKILIATRSAILTTLAHLNTVSTSIDTDEFTLVDGANEFDLDRLKDIARQEPIVRMVSRIIQRAFDDQASDIHIEPFEQEFRIRIRIDGVLKTVETAPVKMLSGVVTRIKILSNLDISERRLPQDGRMRATVRGQELDLRVSISTVIHGEAVVLRLLDRSSVALDLSVLGFESDACSLLETLARLPNGLVLITGPTGSGKTTTLYALLSKINSPDVKIFTVEDPVEYRLDGVTQVQTNAAAGLTFARALRSILRQDPDIILVGEIRDKETAEIAIQAALTGHLVLSTLHTNGAVGAITRLRDIGIADYLIGATLKGTVGQRLVRKRCNCEFSQAKDKCIKCDGSGFAGRTVAYEIAPISSTLSRHISQGKDEAQLLDQIRQEGFVDLLTHASSLVKSSIIDASEVARITLPLENLPA
jgi:general secretion pathway protein E